MLDFVSTADQAAKKENMNLTTIITTAAATLIFASAATAQTRTFTDSKNGISVAYKSGWKTATGKRAATDTVFGDPGKGIKLLKVMPATFQKKYHGTYEFNIWKADDAKIKCGTPDAQPSDDEVPIEAPLKGWARTMKIGGRTFYGYSGSNGGMSKSIALIGYRGIVGGRCLQIQVMTFQVSAFGDFKPFAMAPIEREFRSFLRSVKFKRR